MIFSGTQVRCAVHVDDGPGEKLGAFGGKNDLEGLTETLPIEGTFTLTTDGEVLANNTDEGFTAFEGGKRMVWKVDRISGQAPLALIRLR